MSYEFFETDKGVRLLSVFFCFYSGGFTTKNTMVFTKKHKDLRHLYLHNRVKFN